MDATTRSIRAKLIAFHCAIGITFIGMTGVFALFSNSFGEFTGFVAEGGHVSFFFTNAVLSIVTLAVLAAATASFAAIRVAQLVSWVFVVVNILWLLMAAREKSVWLAVVISAFIALYGRHALLAMKLGLRL